MLVFYNIQQFQRVYLHCSHAAEVPMAARVTPLVQRTAVTQRSRRAEGRIVRLCPSAQHCGQWTNYWFIVFVANVGQFDIFNRDSFNEFSIKKLRYYYTFSILCYQFLMMTPHWSTLLSM